ncbi:hypothetical protein, partial [Acidiplasma aeolicum]
MRNSELLKNFTITIIFSFLLITIPAFIGNILLIDYIHVLIGAIWTGADVFLGLIFYIVLNGLDDNIRSRVAVRILPMTLYFIPAASVITPVLGFILSLKEGIFKLNYLFIPIIALAFILFLMSFILIFRYSMKIYVENKSKNCNTKISGFLRVINITASVQLVIQIIIISLMAYIV